MTVVKINKVGGEDPVPPPTTREQRTTPNPPLSAYTAGKKTLKTFPRGILKTAKVKIKGVADPAKAPPLKSSVKKHTIRILTDKGLKKHRKTIKKKISKMSDAKAKEIAMRAGLVKSASMPGPMVKDVLAGAVTAGFVSLD